MSPAGAPHVLVIDDEPSIVRALLRVLGREFQVTSLPGGEEALAFFEEKPSVDVVMCDLMMPRVDGLAVYRGAMALGLKPRGWILMTGGLVPESVEAFLADHDVHTLTKPFSLTAVVELVRELASAGDDQSSTRSMRIPGTDGSAQ